MPNIFSNVTPIDVLLAPPRQSRDWASFDRDPARRPSCRPPPSNKLPSSPSKRVGQLPGLSNRDFPLGKRGSPMKSRLRTPLHTQMRLSCLEHTALCMLEKDSVGPGGLPSKAVGPITRTKALACANRKLEKVAQQQRWLEHLMSVEEACEASGKPRAVESTAVPPRTALPAANWHFTPAGAAAAAATRAAEAAKAAAAFAAAQAAAEAASAERGAVKVVAKAVVTRPHYLDIRAQSRSSQPWHLPDPAAAGATATSKRAIPVPPSAGAASLTPRAQSARAQSIRARAHSNGTALGLVTVSSSEICLDGTPSPISVRPMSSPNRR